MPGGERNKKAKDLQREKAANAKGQQKLNFSKVPLEESSIRLDQTASVNEQCEQPIRPSTEPAPSASSESSNIDPVVPSTPWVSNKEEFTSTDKQESKGKKTYRYFSGDWFALHT